MSDVPMSDVPISDVPMSDVPMSDVPMSDVPMSDVPMSGACRRRKSMVSRKRNTSLEHASGSSQSTGNDVVNCCSDPTSTRAGGQDDGS